MASEDSKSEDGHLHRRLLALLGISLLLISLIVGLCWLVMQNKEKVSSASACLLRDSRRISTQMSEMDQLKVASADFRTLARLNGFIKYTTSSKVDEFVPLKLNNLTFLEGQNGESKLIFWSACAKLTFNLASDSKQLIVGSVELNTVNVNEHQRECSVTSTSIKLSDMTSSRYLCNTPARYECKSGFWHNNDTFLMKTVAQLELNALEFELDSDPKVARTNQFSKKAESCS